MFHFMSSLKYPLFSSPSLFLRLDSIKNIEICLTCLSETEKLKPNIRRASGLINYPRIGRSNLNFNRRGMEPDTDFQFYNTELDPDKDYEGEVSPITSKRAPLPSYTAIPFHVYFVLFSDRWPIPRRHFAYRAFHLNERFSSRLWYPVLGLIIGLNESILLVVILRGIVDREDWKDYCVDTHAWDDNFFNYKWTG